MRKGLRARAPAGKNLRVGREGLAGLGSETVFSTSPAGANAAAQAGARALQVCKERADEEANLRRGGGLERDEPIPRPVDTLEGRRRDQKHII
jgi:hypothetical protein